MQKKTHVLKSLPSSSSSSLGSGTCAYDCLFLLWVVCAACPSHYTLQLFLIFSFLSLSLSALDEL